jgi:hypothetical protein
MSDKIGSQSATAEATATSEHPTSPTTAPEDAQASREPEPSDTGLESIHTIAPTSSTNAEEEVQPCLDAGPSLSGSFQEKEPNQPKLARSILDNLRSASLTLAIGLLPIYFLLFAALAFKNNDAVLEPGSQAEWLMAAAKYVRSIRIKTSNVMPADSLHRDLQCSLSCLRLSWGSS